MSNNFKFLVAVLVFSSCALAQQHARQAIAPQSVHPQDSTCAVTYSSGTGSNATSFCVTQNGNIAEFSVNGLEFINNGGTPIEGYGVCDATTNTRYGDFINFGLGTSNWQAPAFSVSGNVVTVTRVSTDGIWQLKQTITNVPGTSTTPGSAKISMTLKNLTGASRIAEIIRDAYVSIFSTTNDYNYTSQTAFALITGVTGRGLGLTNDTFSALGESAFVNNTFDPPDPCLISTNQASQPFVGQGSLDMFWEFNVAKGASVTMVTTYHPI